VRDALKSELAEERAAPCLKTERRVAALERCAEGLDLLDQGRPLAAAESFLTSLVLGDLPEEHYGIGVALLATGRFNQARRAFCEAVARDQTFAAAYGELGVAEHLRGRPAAAASAYRNALAIAPNDERYAFNLALALRDCGDPEEARRRLERLGRSKRYGASSGVELALLRLRGGGVGAEKSARRYLEGALRRDPGCVAALYNLGVLLLEDGEERRGRAELSAVTQVAEPGSVYQSLALSALERQQ
jgi:tetratricopeptide (TPR) repeat protein